MGKFNIEKVIRKIENLPQLPKHERPALLLAILSDEDVLQWIFNPPENDPDVVTQENKLYEAFCDSDILKALNKINDEYEDGDLSRTAANVLRTIATLCKNNIAELINDLGKDRKNGKIGKNVYDVEVEKLEKHFKRAKKVEKELIPKIIAAKVSGVSKDTGVPKSIVSYVLTHTPGPKFITKKTLDYYVNITLTYLYDVIEKSPNELYDVFPKKASRRWTTFFGEIFGNNNIEDIAMIVLLEGIKRKKSGCSSTLENCWNSLTVWALDNLEGSEDNTRDQMLEIYVKRLINMFTGNSLDLRVDLLKIPADRYPKLSKSIDKFRDQIKPIMTGKSK